MMLIFTVAAIISIGLMVGTEFTVWVFINPVLWKLEEPARAEAVRLFARKLGRAMPFWYVANFLFLVALFFLLRGQPAGRFLGAASAIWAAVIVLTLIFLVPINNRLARRDAALPLDLAHRQHQRWDTLHRARVIALGTALALLLVAFHP
jgi:uncharacterized membrane protein